MRLTTRGCSSKKFDDSGQNLTICIQNAGHAVRLCVCTEPTVSFYCEERDAELLIGLRKIARKVNAGASRAEFRLGSLGNKRERSQFTPLRATSPRRVG